MLLRNLDKSKGLCNGTRLFVRKILTHTLICTILNGKHAGDEARIPKLGLTTNPGDYPVIIKRHQFPVRVAYAMTIDKSQGQTLQYLGVYLKNNIFSHGQLYVALSRVGSPFNIKVILPEENSPNTMNNIVFRSVLQ